LNSTKTQNQTSAADVVTADKDGLTGFVVVLAAAAAAAAVDTRL